MKKIEITTTQNVVIEYELATTVDRAMAFILDAIFIGVASGVAYIASSVTTEGDEISSVAIIFIAMISTFYHLLFEVFMNGQSPGKKIMNIKVVKINRAHVGFYDYMMRWALRSIEVLGSLGSLAILFSSSSEKGQRIGDVLADTTVIKINKNTIFNLNRLQSLQNQSDFEPKYPLLKHLNDADMLIIKEVIQRVTKHRNPAHLEALDNTCAHLKEVLQLESIPQNKVAFLKALMKEYVIMTR